MKALAKKVLVAAVTVGFLTAAAATTNLSVARAEETKGNPCGPVVLGDEWGKNMPAYGWIHDYVEWKKAQPAEKDDCATVLGDEWGKNMPAYGWIHDYVVDKKAECQEKCGAK